MPKANEIEKIIRFNINASLINDDRIKDLVEALEAYIDTQVMEGRLDELRRVEADFQDPTEDANPVGNISERIEELEIQAKAGSKG